MRLSLMFLCFVFSFSVYAYQNESNKFRGIQWGESINKYKNKFILINGKNGNTRIYKRKNDKYSIGGAKLNKIWYKFYKDKFSAAIVTTKGTSNNSALIAAFKARFGNGNQPNQFIKEYIWLGSSTQIFLKCSNIKSSCTGHFSSKKISKLEADDKQKAAKEGANDF